jgi:hypothetical protein
VITLRLCRRFSADNAFWGFFIGFIIAVAAALITNLHDPSSGPAVLAGVVTAFLATPVVTTMAFFVRRVFPGKRN